MKAMDKSLVDALSNAAIESAQAMQRFARQLGDLSTTEVIYEGDTLLPEKYDAFFGGGKWNRKKRRRRITAFVISLQKGNAVPTEYSTSEEMLGAPNGIYRVYWKSMKSSVAAIGRNEGGLIWFATANSTDGSVPLVYRIDDIYFIRLIERML
jgi:hypothetical protein